MKNEIISLVPSFTLKPAVLEWIQVTFSPPSLAPGLTQQFIATGLYSDGTTQDLTRQVSWSSDTPGVATISNASRNEGLATGVSVGTASIKATLPGISSNAVAVTVSVTAANVIHNADNTVSQNTMGSHAHPSRIAVDPSGRYAYVLNVYARTVSQYAIGSNGVLTAITPVSVSTGSNPYSITVDPSGRYAYVLNVYGRAVSQYTIGPSGVLTAMSSVAVSAEARPH